MVSASSESCSLCFLHLLLMNAFYFLDDTTERLGMYKAAKNARKKFQKKFSRWVVFPF
jgi:hypothetical protein